MRFFGIFMSNNDIDKFYISPYDEFFQNFGKDRPKSPSQLKEIRKYARIFSLRDNPKAEEEQKEIWEKF